MKSFFRTLRTNPSWGFFLAFAFLAGVSMPLARIALVASLVFTLANRDRRRGFRLTSPTVGWLLYLALAAVVTGAVVFFNTDEFLDPAGGFRKLPKLLWYAAIPLAVVQVDSPIRLSQTLRALVAGCAVTALIVLLLNPLLAWVQVSFPFEFQMSAGTATPSGAFLFRNAESLGLLKSVQAWIAKCGQPQTYSDALVKVGTMQAAQRLMVAVPAALCLLVEDARAHAPARAWRTFWLAAICFAGLVVTFKRGPAMTCLAACAVVGFTVLFSRLRWWQSAFVVLLFAGVFVGAGALVPPMRERFRELPAELLFPEHTRLRAWQDDYLARNDIRQKLGGRAILWSYIVPELHREHPWGIGFRSLTWKKIHYGMPALDEDTTLSIRRPNRRVELNLNHVHSTPLQSFVDFGWAGLAVWTIWMGLGFRATGRTARRARRPAPGASVPETACYAAPLAMFVALFLYGLVEYNLADSEVVLLYGLAMGLTGPSLLHSAPVPPSQKDRSADPTAESQAPNPA